MQRISIALNSIRPNSTNIARIMSS